MSLFGTTVLILKQEKLWQLLVLDTFLPAGSWRRVHTQGDDDALAFFCLDPLQFWLLCLVAILVLCRQGGRC